MPEITFFTPPRLDGEAERSPRLKVGDWLFLRTRVKPVYGIIANGMNDLIGYEETYSNPFITQEETDALMQQYRQEMGQAQKEHHS